MDYGTPAQWVLFFFAYGFFGWVWEFCLVSARERRPVNRGFLAGPILPIYGFGAVAILLCTAPVRQSIPLVFFTGMIGATILEYCTGWLMERIFHLRYWDYSRFRLNLDGYICAAASLCWGVFSVLMVRVVHPPVARLIARLPLPAALVLAGALTAGLAVDFGFSVRAALDTRLLLEKLTESRQRVERVRRLAEATAVLAADDRRRRHEEQRGRLANGWKAARQALQRARARRTEHLNALRERLETLLRAGERPELKAGLKEVEHELQALVSRTDRMYRRAFRQLRRNPTARSRDYHEALAELWELFH